MTLRAAKIRKSMKAVFSDTPKRIAWEYQWVSRAWKRIPSNEVFDDASDSSTKAVIDHVSIYSVFPASNKVF